MTVTGVTDVTSVTYRFPRMSRWCAEHHHSRGSTPSYGASNRLEKRGATSTRLSVNGHANHPLRGSMSSRTASCSCGQLRIQVGGEPRGVGICNCLACQRRTGSVFAALASFSAPFKVFGTATEYARVGDQGAKFIFRFCPVCGTTVFHSEDGRDDSVAVAVGAFADPTFPAPQVSVYDCRRHPWVQLPAGITAFERDPT
jgi:hypothetical protein